MPRIPLEVLDCSFYVYRSVIDANEGKQTGGCGFLVQVPSVHPGWTHLYAVTNKHLIDDGFTALRLNTDAGRSEAIETRSENWETLYDSGDVAVIPLEIGAGFKWHAILVDEFISPDIINMFQLQPGDDAFLVGRLVNQSGRQRNTPVVRFGNISLMADENEKVQTVKYGYQEAFLVECRSVSGFSGSAVFCTTHQRFLPRDGIVPWDYSVNGVPVIPKTPKPAVPWKPGEIQTSHLMVEGNFGPWLLGVDWGHLPLYQPMFEKIGNAYEKSETHYYDINTGIACVVPAWRILDILNIDALKAQRQQDDEEIARRKMESSVPDTNDRE